MDIRAMEVVHVNAIKIVFICIRLQKKNLGIQIDGYLPKYFSRKEY